MDIRPIRSAADCDRALREIERLWGAKPRTSQSDRLEVLTTLVEAWEQLHFPLDVPDPVAAIRFRLEQQGLDQSALLGVIGGRSRVHEVMAGRRPLTLAMIRRLHEKFTIPAEVLIRSA